MEILAILITFLLLAVSFILYRYVYLPYMIIRHFRKQGLKGDPFIPFLGQLLKMAKARKEGNFWVLRFFQSYVDKFGRGTFYYCLGPDARLCVTDPKLVQQVLIKENSSFGKPPMMHRLMGPMIGNGILLSDGDYWHRQRKMCDPAFAHSVLQAMTGMMVECSQRQVAALMPRAQKNEEICMHEAMSTVTLDIIGNAAFGSTIGGSKEKAREVYECVGASLAAMFQIMFSGICFIPGFKYLPIPIVKKLMSMRTKFTEIIMSTIRDRREGRSQSQLGKSDLLQLLLEARDDATKTGMTDTEVMAESMTFLAAGHETTSQLMSWSLYLLSQNPEWDEKVHAEADEIMRTDSISTAKFEVITMVLNESMRLFPPVPFIARTCVSATTIGDISVPVGAVVTMPIVMTHRDPELWKDPETFDPSRFANGISKAATVPNAFLPFSNGPRICIGKNFAMMEAKIMLCTLAYHFDWKLSSTYRHDPMTQITLRPNHGMPMFLTPRHPLSSGDGGGGLHKRAGVHESSE